MSQQERNELCKNRHTPVHKTLIYIHCSSASTAERARNPWKHGLPQTREAALRYLTLRCQQQSLSNRRVYEVVASGDQTCLSGTSPRCWFGLRSEKMWWPTKIVFALLETFLNHFLLCGTVVLKEATANRVCNRAEVRGTCPTIIKALPPLSIPYPAAGSQMFLFWTCFDR